MYIFHKTWRSYQRHRVTSWNSVCPSSLHNFQSKAFKSSQNRVRPHMLYMIGKRKTSAIIVWWQWQWQRNTQIKRRRQEKTFKNDMFMFTGIFVPSWNIYSLTNKHMILPLTETKTKTNAKTKTKTKCSKVSTVYMLYFLKSSGYNVIKNDT